MVSRTRKVQTRAVYQIPSRRGGLSAIPDVNERDHFAYGGGRRICPDLLVAEQSLFVNIARLLWGFNVEQAKDENGNDIPVDATTRGLAPGFLSVPKPYKCCTSHSLHILINSDHRSKQET